MKIIQINVQEFHYFDALKKYLREQEADIVCMQEAGSGKLGNGIDSPHIAIAKELGYEFCFGEVVRQVGDNTTYRGNVIMSKFSLIDYSIDYLPDFGAHTIVDLEKSLRCLDGGIIAQRKKIWMFRQSVPFPVTSCVVKKGDLHFRIVSTHLPASSKCTETYLMNRCIEFTLDTLSNKKELPTIWLGDFNIHKDAGCIDHIKDTFDHVNTVHTNTLNTQVHPGFKNDIPQDGYMVDHIFVKGMEILNRHVDTVTISDHYPVIANLSV